MSSPGPQAHQGVALVSMLLIVAIATIIGVAMIQDQQADIQMTRSFLTRGQALQYALGGEEVARQILWDDFFKEGNAENGRPASDSARGVDATDEQATSRRDHLAELWANPELHYEFDQGEVRLRISDLQGRININSLTGPGRPIARRWLSNLINVVAQDADFNVGLVDQLQDWLDTDDEAAPLGAEDHTYLGLNPPYRTAGAPFSSSSELRLLAGFQATGSLFQKPPAAGEPDAARLLLRNIAALPVPGTTLNVNTAGPWVYQSLSAELSFEAAEALILQRDEAGGFESVTEFLQLPELAGLGLSDAGLGVQSSFFEVRVIARYQNKYSYLTSIIHRSARDGALRVIQRDLSRDFSRDFVKRLVKRFSINVLYFQLVKYNT